MNLRDIQIWTGRQVVRSWLAAFRHRWSRRLLFALGRAIKFVLLKTAWLDVYLALRRKDRAHAKATLQSIRVVEQIALQPRHDDVFTNISKYADLEVGWNTHEAGPPSAQAIELAQFFVLLCKKWDTPIDWYGPTADESIMVHVTTHAGIQEWEFFSDGTAALMFKDWGGPKRYLDVTKPVFERILHRHL